jgi:integrase
VRELNGQLARGEDPILQKATARIRQAQTVESLLPRYLAFKRTSLRKRSLVEVTRHLTVNAQDLHPLPVERVTRRDIAALKAAVAESSGGPTSNRVGTSVNGYFVWLMQQGLVESNPCSGTATVRETARSRVLLPEELRAIWLNLEEGTDFSALIKLLALTGCRRNELAQLKWDEIRGDTIELAAARIKNGRPHSIWLSALARDIIERWPRRTNRDGSPRPFVFGSRSDAAGFNAWGWEKPKLDARIAAATGAALPAWHVHDLRRCFSTYCNEYNLAPPHIVEACLGHVGFQSSTASIYNRAVYQSERRQAMERWAELLSSWIEGKTSNVVTLARPA